jgi:predicted phosphoserine aminotransferase
MVGHRSQVAKDLFAGIQPKLREVFQTQSRVFLTSSSGTGLWEGMLRSCTSGRLLLLTCGAFGERWAEVAQSNGIPFDQASVSWGSPNSPEQLEKALAKRRYAALALVHNETSTGILNPLKEIADVARVFDPEMLILVDAVSSAGGVPIATQDWGLDVVVTSSQKCFALPPGLAFSAVSDRAIDHALKVTHRGWYFDAVRLDKALSKNGTPATPAISLLYALDKQLDRILEEGLTNRYIRHADLAQRAQSWAVEHMDLYAQEGYRSPTVTCIRNTRNLDLTALNDHLSLSGMTIASGYGPLKDQTFRIGHMGELRVEDLEILFREIEAFMEM